MAQPQVAGERRRLVADALHQAAVAGDDVGVVVDDFRVLRVLQALGQSKADRHSEPLAKRAGGAFDADRVAILRVTGRPGTQLAEVPQFRFRKTVVKDVQQPVEQCGAVTRGQDEAVTVGPRRIRWIMLQVATPERPRHGCSTHGHPRVATVRCLHHVSREEAQRVDGELVVHELSPVDVELAAASVRRVLTAAAFPSA